MSYTLSKTYPLVKLGEIFTEIDQSLLLTMTMKMEYNIFLRLDFSECLEKCVFNDGMKNKFNIKYIYYYVKAHKILYDYWSIDMDYLKNNISIPLLPIHKQYRLMAMIEKTIYTIKKQSKKIINYDYYYDYETTDINYNQLYDNIIHYFNVIVHAGDENIFNFSDQKKYTYYMNEYNNRDKIIKL